MADWTTYNSASKGVGGYKLVDVTFTPDTSALAAGDLAADTQEIANCFDLIDQVGTLDSLLLIDEDDNATAPNLDVWFLDSSGSLGTENSAPSATDAVIRTVLGKVSVVTADWSDLGGAKVANIKNIGLIVKSASNSRSLYAAVVCGATTTPTFTAAGIKARLGLRL